MQRWIIGALAAASFGCLGSVSEAQNALLDRWVEAFARKDVSAIADMFTADATWEMPPFVGWYRGPAKIVYDDDIEASR